MAPGPRKQESTLLEVPPALDGESVVISGMSGLFPQSHNVKELSDILYNKVNPVTAEKCRWKYNHPEVPPHTGKVPGIDRFDAQFFKVHYRLADTMDAMARKILEQTYQAIYDAGLSPEHLYGKKVGVYIGTCFSEMEKAFFYIPNTRTGFAIAGCNKSMFANRISYWLNAKGPSMSIDQACCSSIAALEQAYMAIKHGECEAAIVGGANLCLHPQSAIHYSRIMTLCMDGKTKSFDQNADGCAKSEAINVLFLQRAKTAKRIYAEVKYVKSEFTAVLEGETGPRYGFYRDPTSMAEFLKHFYAEAKVPPQAVEYIEAFGSVELGLINFDLVESFPELFTAIQYVSDPGHRYRWRTGKGFAVSAIPEADKAELEAIAEVFCKNRRDPLRVGSVMSNIGYGEAASGISAITKVLLGYQKGELAANLHCEIPRRDVAALRESRMQIVTEHMRFAYTYAAVNGISVTGVNAHVLLHGHYKRKNSNRYKTTIPSLVNISGRQDTSVMKIFNDLKSRPIDPEELALFHNIHETKISGHMGRGYTILDVNEDNKTVSLAENSDYFDDAKRPLWFVYSGMGSQWAGMGTQLMRIPIFAAAIERCRNVLEPKGVDIVDIITSDDKATFDNILNSFVGIAAVQIGLTDVLTALGLVPDNIIGHSVGELGCAYADGCFTAEEMILSAYSRGLVSVQTPFIRGSMAAVGVGFEHILKLLPPEIFVACHNGPESSTISGPAEIVHKFVAELTEQGIFAKEVPCSNIAYHSQYIAEAGPGLLKYLSEVIKSPKPRSERWLSTSVPENKWTEPAAKYSSAEYHTNNLLSPVLFEETSKLIPANAVLVEIAPHGLLQAILKRSLPESCRHIPLTRRGHPDNALLVLDAIGKLYMEGYNPKVQVLYPQVEFPVSTGTPMLSHLVEWAHHEQWKLPLYASACRKVAASCKFLISIHDDEHRYLVGHVIRGKNLYPFSAALVAAWDTLAMSLMLTRKQLSVQFRDVRLYAQPVLHNQRLLRLSVALHRGTGWFEIMDGISKVATGFIVGNVHDIARRFRLLVESSEVMSLSSDDVYQLLYERDYFYRGDFRSIHIANLSLTQAQVVWDNNWVTFIDGMLQLNALRDGHDHVSQPIEIRKMSIDIKEHFRNKLIQLDDKTVMIAEVLQTEDIIRCGGVLIENIKFRKLPKPSDDTVALKTLKFIPRFNFSIDISAALQVYLQIVAENINKKTIKVLEIVYKKVDSNVFNITRDILNSIPGTTVRFEQIQRDKLMELGEYFLTDVDLVLVPNLSSDGSLCQILYRVLQRDTYLINGDESRDDRVQSSALYRVISVLDTNKTRLELLRWKPTQISADSTVVNVRTRSDIALLTATRTDLPQEQTLIVLASYPPVAGLKDLVKQWRKESDRNQVYLIMVSDKDILDELPDLDLVFNVLNNGLWGGEYLVEIEKKAPLEREVLLRSAKIGHIDSLQWEEAPKFAGAGIPVTVHFAAINDSDVKRATGVIPFKNKTCEGTYGMDFSGTTDSGERVMGIVESGAVSGRVLARPELLWPVPAHWSLEDAATVPSAYAHAFYCLDMKTQFRRGYTVLVHGGAGALGQAAISIALAHDCEVFATVSDVRKRRFLKKLFPELKEDHIGNSRDTSFGDMVNIATKGAGCNVVISCVKGELKNMSLKVCGFSGITLDTVQIPNHENFTFGMNHLTSERSYIPIDFTSVFYNQNIQQKKRLQFLISEGIARGYVRPLSRVTYAGDEAPRAFRLLAASRHRGRVVLRLRDFVPVAHAQPRLACSPDLCHVLLCGDDDFGLQLAERFISRGAKKLYLHCRLPQSRLELKIKSWAKLGVKVEVSSEDLNSNTDIIHLLNESDRLGPIEGVYVVATSVAANTVDRLTTIVNNLDSVTRKMCPEIKYFAVVNDGHAVGQQTCLSRVRDGLPASTIILPALKTIDDKESSVNNDALSWRGAVDAAEQALWSTHPVLIVHPRREAPPSLLNQIAAIADTRISEETKDNVSLLDLGIELAKVPAICSYLKDTHNLSLEEECVPILSIQKIRELEETILESEFKEVRGLEAFYSYVDPDELLATTEFVLLPTLTNSSTMRDDEFDVSQTFLCIVPGLEGHHERFRVLCERLKLPALVLQPGLDRLHETLRETAQRYTKILLQKLNLKNNFYLLGYEIGVTIALEIAALLEEHGMTGTVYCVGGTPEEIRTNIDEQLCDFKSDEALQDALIRHMFELITGNTEGLDKELQDISSWKEKIDVCVRMLLGQVAHSVQYARTLIEAAYTRLQQARVHTPQPRTLRSRVLLIRTASNTSSSKSSSDILSSAALQRYSQQPVVLHELSTTLAHATYDLRLTNIINKSLDEKILHEFQERNLCETYLVNADTFMTNADEVCE